MPPENRRRPIQQHVDVTVALRGFFASMDTWRPSAEDARALLGALAERTFYARRAGKAVPVPTDTLCRIGYVAGVYKALELPCSDPDSRISGSSGPIGSWGDQTPLQRMRADDVADLAAVRSDLDAARAPWS